MEPVVLTVARDGVRLRVLDWGGTGPDLVLLHPNGFCAGLFDPLARRLAGSRRVLGVDLRGHGGSDAPGDRGA
ncbi:MAG: alpha/beta hydrolase, partial [Acidimicrobiia bacterium]